MLKLMLLFKNDFTSIGDDAVVTLVVMRTNERELIRTPLSEMRSTHSDHPSVKQKK
jgi:hypothetical protein